MRLMYTHATLRILLSLIEGVKISKADFFLCTDRQNSDNPVPCFAAC